MLQTLLFFHLIAVVTLFAGIGLDIAAFVSLHRASTLAEVRAAMLHVPLVGPLMISGVLLLLAMGISMAYLGGYGWQPWIVVALAITVILAANGKLVNGVRAEAIHALAQRAGDGAVTPEVETRRRDPVLNYSIFMSSFELVAMLYIMSAKPALTGSLLVVVVALLLAFVPTALILRRPSPAAQTAQG